MSRAGKGTIVVGIWQQDIDVERLKSEVSGLRGVSEVRFDYFNRKLTINYDGTQNTLDRINGKLTRLPRSE